MKNKIQGTKKINQIVYDPNEYFMQDTFYDVIHNIIPRHPNGTKFYWSAGIILYNHLRALKNSFGLRTFEVSTNLKRKTLLGIEIKFDRTDNEIHLLVKNDN